MTTIYNSSNVSVNAILRIPVDVSSSGGPSHVTMGDVVKYASNNTYPALNYGIIPDGRWLTTASVTASSTTLSASGYTFTSADVGKYITVNAGASTAITGTTTNNSNIITVVSSMTAVKINHSVIGTGIPAGTVVEAIVGPNAFSLKNMVTGRPVNATATGSGIALTIIAPLNTTIASVSGGNAVLTTAASTTASNLSTCFGTDNLAVLQSLFNTVSTAGGGKIKLPSGISVLSGSINYANGVSVCGEGQNTTVLKWISNDHMTSAVIHGPGSAANLWDPYTIEHLCIDCDAATQASYNVLGKAIYITYSSDSTITYVKTLGTPATSIGPDFIRRAKLTHNTVIGGGRCDPSSGGSGLAVAIGKFESESYIITNNFIEHNNGRYGIFTETLGGGTMDNLSAIIANNTIQIVGLGTPTGQHEACIGDVGMTGSIIANNSIVAVNDTVAANTRVYGIGLNNSTNLPTSVRAIVIGNNISGVSRGIDIEIASTIDKDVDFKIHSNLIHKCTGSGINIFTNMNATTGHETNGIDISGNTINQCGSSAITIAGASTAKYDVLNITGNILKNNGNGFNPSSGINFTCDVQDCYLADNWVCNTDAITPARTVWSYRIASSRTVTGNVGFNKFKLPFSVEGTSNLIGSFKTHGLSRGTRTITTGASDNVAITDYGVYWNKTTGSSSGSVLPAGSANIDGLEVVIGDGKGDAATNNITITAADAATIRGGTSLVLNTAYASVKLQYVHSMTKWI